ncbi:MAG: hypothetical protein WAL91_05620 [Propionicimonas sp.]
MHAPHLLDLEVLAALRGLMLAGKLDSGGHDADVRLLHQAR